VQANLAAVVWLPAAWQRGHAVAAHAQHEQAPRTRERRRDVAADAIVRHVYKLHAARRKIEHKLSDHVVGSDERLDAAGQRDAAAELVVAHGEVVQVLEARDVGEVAREHGRAALRLVRHEVPAQEKLP
jgi:hypothetical protein